MTHVAGSSWPLSLLSWVILHFFRGRHRNWFPWNWVIKGWFWIRIPTVKNGFFFWTHPSCFSSAIVFLFSRSSTSFFPAVDLIPTGLGESPRPAWGGCDSPWGHGHWWRNSWQCSATWADGAAVLTPAALSWGDIAQAGIAGSYVTVLCCA